jgi:cob(I)alamin adenosyltransferase
MPQDKFKTKDSVIVVYTGESKGKTSASLGLMVRALGADWKVAYVQFIKLWDVSEHAFIQKIMPLYEDKLDFYKGGLGFYEAGELSSSATEREHREQARSTYDFAYECATSGKYQLVICDEINNAVNDGLLPQSDLERLIVNKHPMTSLCLTGRDFPEALLTQVDIATNMTKLRHHFDDNFIANKGIDF